MNTTQISLPTQGRLRVLSVLAILVISSLLTALIWKPAFGAPAVATQRQIDTRTSLSPNQLYTSLLASVVRVEGSGGVRAEGLWPGENGSPRSGMPDMTRFFDARTIGAGFFIDDDGHIITSLSIIEGADTIHVTFADGAWYAAEIVGTDRQADFAILHIPDLDHDFAPLAFAQDDTLGIGDPVFAFGYPEGMAGTLTQGIVNNMEARRTGRNGYLLPYLIQSDAVSLPGLAGSPLVNEFGEAVGVNMNMHQPFGTPQALNLSIPIELAQQITPALIQGQPYAYPLLGVAGIDLSPVEAAAMEVNNLYQGAYISAVGEDTAAAKGGIQEGDFLTAVNGTPIRTFSSLANQLLVHHTGGEEVQISVLRGDSSLDLTITLGTRELADS